jgi:hypothetical protein
MMAAGIMVWVPTGFELEKNPIISALKDAGLSPGFVRMPSPDNWPFKPNVWIVFVGERYPISSGFPFSPSGSGTWQEQPLRK